MPTVMLPWTENLPFMQQSVLITATRAPDGLKKDHPVKVILRWYRRCIMWSAFERKWLKSPFEHGGGSFTGPFSDIHAAEMGIYSSEGEWETFDQVRGVYLRYVDEMPHHFQLHLMHAVEILGYHYPDDAVRKWWNEFYLMIVNDMHLFPETFAQMSARLGDNEAGWRAREEVIAK